MDGLFLPSNTEPVKEWSRAFECSAKGAFCGGSKVQAIGANLGLFFPIQCAREKAHPGWGYRSSRSPRHFSILPGATQGPLGNVKTFQVSEGIRGNTSIIVLSIVHHIQRSGIEYLLSTSAYKKTSSDTSFPRMLPPVTLQIILLRQNAFKWNSLEPRKAISL